MIKPSPFIEFTAKSQYVPPMKNADKIYFTTTEELSFQCHAGVIELRFGKTRLLLNEYAAQDMTYRMASFLSYLEHLKENPSSASPESNENVSSRILEFKGKS